MTIRIPVQFLLFMLYTVAVLAGAFGISYAVFEWRDGDGASDSDITIESLYGRIDDLNSQVRSLEGQVGSLTNRIGSLSSPSDSDSTQCHGAILSLILVTIEAQQGQLGGTALERELRELQNDFNAYC